MHLLGDFVKNALTIKERIWLDSRSVTEKQDDELKSLLRMAQDTAFGKYYDFKGILETDDVAKEFRSRVPLHRYEDIHERWWHQQQKFPDITWPGRPDYFALTSGTTGSESKRIPVTQEFIKSMRKVGLDQLAHLADAGVPETIFESEALVISSSASLRRHEQHLEGEISGINVSNFPVWYDLFYRPGKKISAIDDWEKRTDRIAEKASEWNIGTIVGIPSWVQLCLQKVIEKNNVEFVDDLWPNAKLYMSGGVAFDTYEESFRGLFRNEIIVVDTYLASEGFFAFGTTQDSYAMRLALSHGYYFEFIPFDETGFDAGGNVLEDPKIVTIGDVKPGRQYALVISTCAGAWRYLIGDTIVFEKTDIPTIHISGRTKHWLNVVGSQLTEEKLDNAISKINEKKNADINEYSVSCLETKDGYIHKWVLVTDNAFDSDDLSSMLDEHLKKANNNYNEARKKALSGVEVKLVSKSQYKQWLENQNKLGGQVKIRKVMPEEDMRDFLSYIDELV